MNENPKIIKVVFIVQKNKRQYEFDVNQNITIYLLKKMLAAASDLEKCNLRLFHDNKEYNAGRLDILFPNQDRIVFTLEIEQDEFALPLTIKLNNKYCLKHDGKYPFFYCYNCKKSICTECASASGEHNGHEIKEKCDYLQSSIVLIKQLLDDVNSGLKGMDIDEIKALKQKVSVNFSELVDMIKKIEKKIIDLIDEFVKKKEGNIKTYTINLNKLREYYIEGLNILKEKLDMKYVVIDERVFLTFDEKIKEIDNEKEKYIYDFEKCQEYKKQLDILKAEANKIYLEIKGFLERYLLTGKYDDIRRQIEDVINIIKKEDIVNKFSNVRGKPKKQFSSKKTTTYAPISSAKKDKFEKTYINENSEMEIDAPMGMDVEEETYIQTRSTKTQHPLTSVKIVSDLFICQPIPKTREILVYSMIQDTIAHKKATDSELTLHFFPEKGAWYNYKNILYITGGADDKRVLSSFFSYDPKTNRVVTLPDLPAPRHSHTMCTDTLGNLYVIGGNLREIHKFNTNTLVWETLKTSLTVERHFPICYIKNNNELYVFFGIDSQGRYLSNGEYGKLSTGISGMINGNNIKLINSGLIESDANNIIFFGGKDENGVPISTAMNFNFETKTFESTPFSLNEGSSFHQNVMPSLTNETFGNFSLEKGNSFIKIDFN